MLGDAGDAAYIYDMLAAGEAVVRHVSGKTRNDFDTSEMLRDAIERKVEIFGEATIAVVPPSLRDLRELNASLAVALHGFPHACHFPESAPPPESPS